MENGEIKQGFIQQKIIHFNHPRIGTHTIKVGMHENLFECRNFIENSTQFFLFNNYQFQCKGKKLSELEPIFEIVQEVQVTIDLVLIPYDARTAKYHLGKVMQVLKMPEIYAYIRKDKRNQQVLNQPSEQQEIPSWVNDFSLTTLKPDLGNQFLKLKEENNKKIDFLHSISLSGFNPPPITQQLSGDLFYIHIKTLEPSDIHITASPYGFFVNQSKISNFNPARSTQFKNLYASLIDLLKSVSEKFKEKLSLLLDTVQISQSLKCKMMSLGKYRTVKWLQQPQPQHGWNNPKVLADEHIRVDLLSMKDWNQAFQMIQKLKSEQSKNPVQYNCQLAKIYSDFQAAAIEGATSLVDGKISPLNPTDDKKRHIYIYNKIFFSIANETPYDHSQEKGDDATPSSSSVNTDLINISILQGLEIPELHVLHMVIVSYRGYKIIAQGIIPGILSVDQINCSQYGSLDDGKTIETNPQFQKLMVQVCEKLGLQDSVKVTDGQGEVKKIAGSPDIKGILGTDQRKYILDLLRLSPRDLNYPGAENETCVIRPQLLKHFRAMKSQKKEELPKINVNIGTQLNFIKDQSTQGQENLLKQIAQYIKSTAIINLIDNLKKKPSHCLTDNSNISKIFHQWGVNMRYIGDVVNHELLKNDTNIKMFLKRIILIRSLKHLFRMGMRQTNILYLSQTLTNLLNTIFGRQSHINILEEGEKKENEGVENNSNGQQKESGNQGKKKKKKKNKEIVGIELEEDYFGLSSIKIPFPKFGIMKPSQVWMQVSKIAKARFNYEFQCKTINQLDLFKYPFQKIATLRDVCLSVGLVLQRKGYDITEGNKDMNDKIFPFTAKNIVSIEAKSKRMKVQPPNLAQREEQSEKLIEKFQVKQVYGKDQILEEENLKMWGGCNETVVKIYQRRSRVLYILGDYKSAANLQELNLNILQAISSPDSMLAIKSHQNLGIYYIGLGEKQKVIYHEKKSIYLMLTAFGETAPDLLVALVNLAKIYQINKDYERAMQCYHVGIHFLQKIFGKTHIELSFCNSSLASICYQRLDLKKAIEYQTETVSILIQILPENDSRLQDAIKILKTYRQMYQSGINQSQIMTPKVPQPKKEQEKGKKKNKK